MIKFISSHMHVISTSAKQLHLFSQNKFRNTLEKHELGHMLPSQPLYLSIAVLTDLNLEIHLWVCVHQCLHVNMCKWHFHSNVVNDVGHTQARVGQRVLILQWKLQIWDFFIPHARVLFRIVIFFCFPVLSMTTIACIWKKGRKVHAKCTKVERATWWYSPFCWAPLLLPDQADLNQHVVHTELHLTPQVFDWQVTWVQYECLSK